MGFLDFLLKRKGERSRTPLGGVIAPPEDLLDALAARDYGRISSCLIQWSRQSPTSEDVEQLVAAAKSRGLIDAEVEKVSILADYYTGNAAKAYERARSRLSVDVFDSDLYVLCAFALYHNNLFDEAHRFVLDTMGHDEALTWRGDFWFVRALACWATNDMSGLKEAVDRACELAPNDMGTLENAQGMYLELGELQRFQEVRTKLQTGAVQPGYAYALNTLAIGDYEDGFRRMEARYELDEAHRYLNKALFPLPRWKGEDLAGKSLLISAEQGLGDTIQMARYLGDLGRLGASQVVMETQEQTLSLLIHNFSDVEFCVREYGKLPPVAFDVWTGAMSLPHLLGTTRDKVPRKDGYLRAPSENVAYWRDRVNTVCRRRRPRIGLAWSGQPIHRSDRRRSMAFPLIGKKIREIDADFFALQTSVPAHSLDNLWAFPDEMLTLADTAALINELDLVITIDTCAVHLAGALAKQTWLMLPYRYEWRWGLEGECNSWYDSVRVLRQYQHGDWAGLLDEIFDRRLPEWRKLAEEWR